MQSATARGSALPKIPTLSVGPSLFAVGPMDPIYMTDDDDEMTRVGLTRVEVADSIRGRVRNDVILEMAIQEVTETLYVFVDASDAHAAVAYTSELYNVVWDLCNAAKKPQLQVTIVSPHSGTLTWDELFNLPQLNAVYGDVPMARDDTKWLPRAALPPVHYRLPVAQLKALLRDNVGYFEDDEESYSKHPVVIVNGTFDHLHNGHRKLLALAANVCSERLVVGITAACELLDAKPVAHLMEPLETRKRKVAEFLASMNPTLDVELVDVHEKLGPAVNFIGTGVLVVGSTSDAEELVELFTWCSAHQIGCFTRIVRRTDRSTLSSSRIRERIAAQQKTVA